MGATRTAIVLAAGKGTRMNSDLPKVLFPCLGRPLIEYVLDVLQEVRFDQILVVIGYRSHVVRQALAHRHGLEFVEQTEQLGTGHAVQVCRDYLAESEGPVVVVTGDSPLIQASSIQKLLDDFQNHEPACILGTLKKRDPSGLGRIVRDSDGEFLGVVEEKDASRKQLLIKEVNMSTYVFDCGELISALDRLSNDNQQGEYYITDCPGILKSDGKAIRALPILQPCEALSVNHLDELKLVESEMQKRR